MEALLFILLVISIYSVFPEQGLQVMLGAGLHFSSQTIPNPLLLITHKVRSGSHFRRSPEAGFSCEQQKNFSPPGAPVVAEINDFYIFRIWQGRKKEHKHLFLTFGNPELTNST